MPVMPVGADRTIDITDVSASQGALRYFGVAGHLWTYKLLMMLLS